VAAETWHDLVGRGTVAARGRGRPGRRPASSVTPDVVPDVVPEVRPDVADALAAAERDAYEGRFGAAIRRLEAIGPHPDVDAALLTYRQEVAARDAAKAQGAARVITDVIRAHVGGVRAALSAGRWREAQELLRSLERDVPAPDDASGAGSGEGEPIDVPQPIRRDDEVAHYLSRARRRLEAGDVTAAQSLLDAALDMTRTP
jgi:hypothetical protein